MMMFRVCWFVVVGGVVLVFGWTETEHRQMLDYVWYSRGMRSYTTLLEAKGIPREDVKDWVALNADLWQNENKDQAEAGLPFIGSWPTLSRKSSERENPLAGSVDFRRWKLNAINLGYLVHMATDCSVPVGHAPANQYYSEELEFYEEYLEIELEATGELAPVPSNPHAYYLMFDYEEYIKYFEDKMKTLVQQLSEVWDVPDENGGEWTKPGLRNVVLAQCLQLGQEFAIRVLIEFLEFHNFVPPIDWKESPNGLVITPEYLSFVTPGCSDAYVLLSDNFADVRPKSTAEMAILRDQGKVVKVADARFFPSPLSVGTFLTVPTGQVRYDIRGTQFAPGTTYFWAAFVTSYYATGTECSRLSPVWAFQVPDGGSVSLRGGVVARPRLAWTR